MEKDWLLRQRMLTYTPHPNSPAGRFFDWSSFDMPHPGSPAGKCFDWTPLDFPHPYSPAGLQYIWSAAPTPTVSVDSAIEALDLAATAKAAAYELKKLYPQVIFTSGRRGLEDQARAMASNVVKNRKWIQQTYQKSVVSQACQKWVDNNPTKKTKDEIATGLKSVFDSLTEAQVSQISKHLSGEAFDVQPVTKDAPKVKKIIRGLKGLTKFLDKEGGLVRWHAQF
jgi:hypothetical protein